MSKGPVRLEKVTDDSYHFNLVLDWIEAWLNRHALFCLFVLFALLISAFLFLMFSLVGISAVESGAMRNFVNGGYI